MLKIIDEVRTPEVVAEEYLEWRDMVKETEKKAKELRKELLSMVQPMHQSSLGEGRVEKVDVGAATVNYVGRFKAMTPTQMAELREQLPETYDRVVSTTEAVSVKAGITLDVLEAVVGETKMARLLPLLEAKQVTKLAKGTYAVIANLYAAGDSKAADALLQLARATGYEPYIK